MKFFLIKKVIYYIIIVILINNEFVEEANHYYSIIHDKNGKQTKLHLVCEMTEIESYIRRLTQSIKHILELVPYDYHSYCLFTIKSNNVYFLNLLTRKLEEHNYKVILLKSDYPNEIKKIKLIKKVNKEELEHIKEENEKLFKFIDSELYKSKFHDYVF